jgi:hypothetical protein
VNTVGAAAMAAFFVCLIAGAIAFIPFYSRLRVADPERPLNVWKDLEVRKTFLRFVLIWLASLMCLAVAMVFGGLPTGYE